MIFYFSDVLCSKLLSITRPFVQEYFRCLYEGILFYYQKKRIFLKDSFFYFRHFSYFLSLMFIFFSFLNFFFFFLFQTKFYDLFFTSNFYIKIPIHYHPTAAPLLYPNPFLVSLPLSLWLFRFFLKK